MRVAVTGASGFVGGAVAASLAAAGLEVMSFGRRARSAVARALPNYESWDIDRGPCDLDVDAVVHCAASVGQWGPNKSFVRTNVAGTANVVASMPPNARLVYVSTASVYGHVGASPVDECAATGGASAYGRTKLAGERHVLARSGASVVLRPHIVYGPGDTTLWPRVIASRRNGALSVPGNGRNRVSVTHIGNLVHAVHCALLPDAPDGVYNIADLVIPTLDELLRTMFARHDEPVRLRYIRRRMAWAMALACEAVWRVLPLDGEPTLTRFAVAGLADPCELELGRARRLLGYAPRWTFRDGPL